MEVGRPGPGGVVGWLEASVGPVYAAEVGDEVADPAEAVVERGGQGLGDYVRRCGVFGWLVWFFWGCWVCSLIVSG